MPVRLTGTFEVVQVWTPNAVSVDMGNLDLTGLSGTQVYVGYGLGTGAAADTDVLTGKYSSWAVQ